VLANDLNVFPVVYRSGYIAFPFNKDIELASGFSTSKVFATLAYIVDTSSVGQKLLLKAEQPFNNIILHRRVRKSSPLAASLLILYGSINFLGLLSPGLSLKIFGKESSYVPIYITLYFLEYPCFH